MRSRSYANHGRQATTLSKVVAPAVVISCLLCSESPRFVPVRHGYHGDDSVVDGPFEVLRCYPQRLSAGGDKARLALRIFDIRSLTCAMSHMLPDSAVMPRCFLAWSYDWIGWLALVPILSRGMGGPIRPDLSRPCPPRQVQPVWGPAFVIRRLERTDVICCKIFCVSPIAKDRQLPSSLPIPPRCETWC